MKPEDAKASYSSLLPNPLKSLDDLPQSFNHDSNTIPHKCSSDNINEDTAGESATDPKAACLFADTYVFNTDYNIWYTACHQWAQNVMQKVQML